ncbi:BnaUnng02800D [Brassica napus]|uniref:BnaUnng02800D protein n=1 Tax=Brassica napus TaxID=3708 RepID=A0A078JN55_BRANA|nr:BnaUnng02800D [Brassica napus]
MVNLPPTGLGRSPIYPWLYWHLWKNRNRLVFEGKSCTVQELILKALTDARNWEEATQMEKRTSPPLRVRPALSPMLPGLRCYTDGAWDPVSGHSGQGWAFIDPTGATIRHQSCNRLHVAAPIVAEALAINILSDSKSLVNLLNSSTSTALLQSVLFDIRVLSCRLDSITFSFVPRLENVVADSLAKAALSHSVSPLFGG